MSRLSTLLLAGLPLLATLATAQTSTIIDRAEQAPPTPPPTPGTPAAPETPGAGTDEGTQRLAEPRRLPLRLLAALDTQVYATDNIFLVPENDPQSSKTALVSVTTLTLRADTLPTVLANGQLTGSVGLTYQRYLHGIGKNTTAISDLDFESYALPLSAAYRWGRGWEATSSLTLGQLYSVGGAPAHEKLYASTTGGLGLRKLTEFRRDLILSTGVNLAHAETWTTVPAALPYRDDKFDTALDAALYYIKGNWVLTPYVRLGRTHYYHYEEAGPTALDRDDTTLTGGLSISYNYKDMRSIRLFGSYDQRFSSQDNLTNDYTYESGTLGLGLSASLRF